MSQLFVLLRDVEVPGYAVRDPVSGTFSNSPRVIPAAFSMLWPNGTPCVPAELFLADRMIDCSSTGAGGGSLRDLASCLSPLVRFCWDRKLDFWDLRDSDFSDFVGLLQDENVSENASIRRRGNNRVERIVDIAITFLRWIQEWGFSQNVIVAPREKQPQIPLDVRRIYDRRSRSYRESFRYRYSPVPSTHQPKGPIGAAARLKLWDAVTQLSSTASLDPRYRNRFATQDDFLFEREYIRKRRELLLDILGATGARPGEIAELSLLANQHCSSTCRLVIITLKRRERHVRKVPINRGLAIRLELFIKEQRARLVKQQMERVDGYQECDKVFLSVKGEPISGATFEREFSRLVHAAGLESERACMSMFRHRFITNMVALHLKELTEKRPGCSRHLFTDSDYRSILRRVASFTGHRNVESLMTYIDLAWDELGVYEGVDPTKNLLCSLEGAVASLEGLVEELEGGRGKRRSRAIERIRTELVELREAVTKSRTSNRH